jgi:hypothetical protein
VAVVLALILSGLFGATDQYLGNFSMHPWMIDVSLLSAPWLVLPFIVGYTQRDPKRAALLGLACTFAALIGYAIMTLSGVENAHLSLPGLVGFARSERLVLAGGVVTGPLFGWLGHRWRLGAVWGALATAAALCLEPLARMPTHNPIGSTAVLLSEVAVGVAALAYVVVRLRAGSRTSTPADG